MQVNSCPLPTKADDATYKRMVNEFSKLGPKVPAFQAAIDKLLNTSPTKAHKDLSMCAMRGGTPSSPKTSQASPKTSKTSPKSTEAESKTKCYMIAMSQITAGLVGIGGGIVNFALPYLASLGGIAPCDGLTDQAIGGLASLWDSNLSCAAREAAFYGRMVKIAGGASGLLSIGFRKTLMKSPTLFKLLLNYLAARQCPELFNNYSFKDFTRDVEAVYGGASLDDIMRQAESQGSTATASSVRGREREREPERERSQQPAGDYYQYQEGEYIDDPEETLPARGRSTRASRRSGRGGKNRRSTRRTRSTRKTHKRRGKSVKHHKKASKAHRRR